MKREVKVRITIKDVYECYVEVDDTLDEEEAEELAEELAYQKHINGETDLVYDGLEYEVEE